MRVWVVGLLAVWPGLAAGNDAAFPGARMPEGPGAGPSSVEIGAQLYVENCASCHGAGARGDGPLAGLLTVPVPDLAGLAARSDGAFPMLDVVHTIDGRTGRRAHGGAMPVWGAVFAEPPGFAMGLYGSALEARGRVMALALYLESIQERGGPE